MYKQYKKGIEELEGRFYEADIKLLDLGGFTSKQVQDFIKSLLKQHTINLIDSEIEVLEEVIKEPELCNCIDPESEMNRCKECKLVLENKYPLEERLQDQITRLQQEKEKIINDNK